ncbi:MAG: MotA/TolQ/ExbB proton channel family protein, partial [Mucilaginibacter sp.]
MATAPTKPTTPVKKESSSATGMFAVFAIPICLIVGILIYWLILGDPSHYAGGDPEKGLPQDIFGTVHRGGKIVPVIMSFVLMVIVFSIERAIVIGKAAGTGNVDSFVRKITS